MRSKYEPLEIYLQERSGSDSELSMGFGQIEEILGARLPASAYKYREWWANQSDTKNRPHAKAWLSAGFVIDSVQFKDGSGSVIFKRR